MNKFKNQSYLNGTNEISILKTIEIPRKYLKHDSPVLSQTPHGFSDASEKAFGAVLYSRKVYQDTIISTSLVISKTKVAPIHKISIPKLELLGAVLLAEIAHSTAKDLNISSERVYLWTDSTIVPAWLQNYPSTKKAFVSHRTSIILDLFPSSIWRHICTTSNPADHCSRGLSPKELKDCKLWWSGPGWLSLPAEKRLKPTPISLINVPEIRPVVLFIAPQPIFSLSNKYSSFSKLVRIVAYCLRFLFHCKFPVPQTIPM